MKQDLIIDNTIVKSSLGTISTLITKNTREAISEASLSNHERKCLPVPIDELYDEKWKLRQIKSTSHYLT